MSPRDQFISELEGYLEYKKEEGVQTLEISPETLAALQAQEGSVLAFKHENPDAEMRGLTPQGSLEEIAGQIRVCSACPLCNSRKNTVPGEGNPNRPDVMFIGEGPGAEEDAQGRPFVGAAGQLLDKMIRAMGYQREDVFIANIVKCRPPGNRVPLPAEMDACLPYLRGQIALIQPKVIVALGKTAVQGLLHGEVAITKFRGTWCTCEGIALMPTYHPAYLLRSPGKKGEAWADLKAVLKKLGKTPPPKK